MSRRTRGAGPATHHSASLRAALRPGHERPQMTTRTIDVRGRKVAVAEAGDGPPLVYLHGFADVHGVADNLMPFHQRLARDASVFAPAHPGCNGSDELPSSTIDDVIFH